MDKVINAFARSNSSLEELIMTTPTFSGEELLTINTLKKVFILIQFSLGMSNLIDLVKTQCALESICIHDGSGKHSISEAEKLLTYGKSLKIVRYSIRENRKSKCQTFESSKK